MQRHTVQIFFFVWLLASPDAWPQTPIADVRFRRLTTHDGLSEGTIHCIFQDSRGFVWISTGAGLQKYDGYAFKSYSYDPRDSNSISDNSVRCMYEDRSGLLWLGTYLGGLNVFDRSTETFTHFRHDPNNPQSISSNAVTVIHEDEEGRLWIGTSGGGLNVFDKTTKTFRRFKNETNPQPLQDNYVVHFIHEDSAGFLWMGIGRGLVVFDKKTEKFRFFRYSPDQLHPSICAFEDNDGFLWIGTVNGGIDIFDKKTETFRNIKHEPNNPNSLSHNTVRVIYQDLLGLLWIGTNAGVDVFDRATGQFRRYKHNPDDPHDPESLSGYHMSSICEDASGMLWIGGDQVTLLDRKAAKFKLQYMKDRGIYSIHEDRDSVLWVGTTGDGLYAVDRKNKTSTIYTHAPDNPRSLLHNVVYAIHEDREGLMWIGTKGGLNALDKKRGIVQSYPIGPNGLTGAVLRIHEDAGGLLWIGTAGSGLLSGGLCAFDKRAKSFRSFKLESTSKFDVVWSIHEDSLGQLWLGTFGGGLVVFTKKTEKWRSFRHDPADPQSLSTNGVACLHEDRFGLLWIGTNSGLNVFDRVTETFRSFTEKDGLPSNKVYGILEDDHGNLWLSTGRGLTKFTPPVDPFNLLTPGLFRIYDVSDGLLDFEFNSGAYFKNRDGWMYFGGPLGFYYFHPDSVRDNPYKPPVVISDFQIFNTSVGIAHGQNGTEVRRIGDKYFLSQSILETDEIGLTYKENVFSFEFKALSYLHAEKNQYAYKLEGFDADWVYCGTRRTAAYTNLDPGEYVFRVKGSNHDGVWNEEGTSVKITILPPPWKTWWAYSCYGLLTLGFLYGLRRFELNRKLQKAQVTESKVRAEAAEAHSKAAEAQAKVIQIENDRRAAELEEARQLQLSMLPKDIPKLDHLDIAVSMKTATEVGGDYYDFHLSADGTLTIVLGDATGHGLKAGHMVSTVKGLFNAYAASNGVAVTLSEMSRCIKDMRLSRLSMCLLMARIQPPPTPSLPRRGTGGGLQGGGKEEVPENEERTVRLHLSSAAMPPALVYRHAEKRVDEILIKALPLGAMRNVEYQERELELHTGDTILFMSDGFPELTNDTGETLGYERAMEIFEKACSTTSPLPPSLARRGIEGVVRKERGGREVGRAHALLDRLHLAANNWSNGRALVDDMTVLVVRVTGQ